MDQRFAFKNSGILCLALIFNLSNLRKTILHANEPFQVARYSNKLEWTHGWLRWVTLSLATWVQFSQSAETFGCWRQFCVALRPSVHWDARLHIAALSTKISFVDLVGGNLVSADKVLTFNMKIRLLLFWSTWSQARGQDLVTCAGLARQRDYSVVEPLSKIRKVFGHCLSLNCRNYLKNSGPQ